MNAGLLGRILRSPADVARACRDESDVRDMAANALAALVVGSALFGLAVGSWHGSRQALFSAMKMPLVTLGTLAVCAPAFYGISAVFGRAWSARTVLSLMLVAGARFALVLLAATPVLWLAINLGASYDVAKVTAAAAYALGGLAALTLMLRGLGDGPGKLTTLALFVGIFLVVGGQTAWVLRPYLGTPGKDEVVLFTREREGGMAYQLWKSAHRVITDTPYEEEESR